VGVWIYPRAISVRVVVEDVEAPEAIADAVISTVEREALISDKLMSALYSYRGWRRGPLALSLRGLGQVKEVSRASVLVRDGTHGRLPTWV